jgi:16S rRNA (adenine1518-N6/adenine1519-N6)-dimethyltransferase
MLRKHLGQHFLRDQSIIEQWMITVRPQSTDIFLEIGPGDGALSRPLLPKISKLYAIEIDQHWAGKLQAYAQDSGKDLTLKVADALTVDFNDWIDASQYRLIGNLPYNISTPLLFHFLRFRHRICDMHFLLQKEVVERAAAHPGSKIYGRLSVMLQYYCAAEQLFAVPASAFYPPPKVESALLRLKPIRPVLTANNEDHFARIVQKAFSQRRKMLRKSLSAEALLAKDWQNIAIDPSLRPEQLRVEDFVLLSNYILDKSS